MAKRRKKSKTLSPWQAIIIAVIWTVILASMVGGYFARNNLVGGVSEAALWAASQGDYQVAQALAESQSEGERQVLGANLESEESIYPEHKLERELEQTEALILRWGAIKELYLRQAKLLEELGRHEEAQDAQEMARKLDPNNTLLE